MIKPEELKDITGFEKYLWALGFTLETKSKYFNTFNGCDRLWRKEDKYIRIGLQGSPTRVGILHPVVLKKEKVYIKNQVSGKVIISYPMDMKYTYLPEPDKYEEFLNTLIQ